MPNKDFEKLVRQEVLTTLREVFCDPEYNLDLSSKTKARLKKSLRSKEQEKTIDAQKFFQAV
ncbi:MAG: hypothetical protein AAB416_03485 [Patescibacteria group bacterium]